MLRNDRIRHSSLCHHREQTISSSQREVLRFHLREFHPPSWAVLLLLSFTAQPNLYLLWRFGIRIVVELSLKIKAQLLIISKRFFSSSQDTTQMSPSKAPLIYQVRYNWRFLITLLRKVVIIFFKNSIVVFIYPIKSFVSKAFARTISCGRWNMSFPRL